MVTKMDPETATTLRLNQHFYRRLKAKLAAEGTTFQEQGAGVAAEQVEVIAAMLELADHQLDQAGYGQWLRDHGVPL
jgi:hypothetical protein